MIRADGQQAIDRRFRLGIVSLSIFCFCKQLLGEFVRRKACGLVPSSLEHMLAVAALLAPICGATDFRKVGIVEGKVVELRDVEAIASLPSKEELISKVLFLINAQAQRLVTVLSAVPRNLAIVVKQIGDQKGGETA